MTNYSHEKYQLNDFKHMYFFEVSDGNSRTISLYSKDIINKIDFNSISGQIFSKDQIEEQKSFPINDLEKILSKYDAKILYFENLDFY